MDAATPMGGNGQGAPPASGGMPGMGDPTADLAMSALGQLGGANRSNPTAALQQVERAYDLAHQLVLGTIPQLQQFNPKAARDAHAAARTLLSIRSTIRQEAMPMSPPDLMLGMGMGGLPPAGPPSGIPGM